MYILQNWDSIVAIVAIVILVTLTIAKVVISFVARIKAAKEAGEKADQIEILQQIIFGLVTDAERDLGAGTGKLKFSKVAGWIYEKIPDELKMLFTAEDIETMIESVLEEAQKYWDQNTNARDYIDSGVTSLLTAEANSALLAEDAAKAIADDVATAILEAVKVPQAADDKEPASAESQAEIEPQTPGEGAGEPPEK